MIEIAILIQIVFNVTGTIAFVLLSALTIKTLNG